MFPEVLLTYGSGSSPYSFEPVPFLSINRTINQDEDGNILGFSNNITLDGTLTIRDTGSLITIRQMQDDLISAFSVNGAPLTLTCGGQTGLLVFPIVEDISFAEGTWLYTSPFNISLRVPELVQGSGGSYISSFTEEWSVQLDDNAKWSWNLPNGSGTDQNTNRLLLTHNVNAVGITHFNTTGRVKGLDEAKVYVNARLGIDNAYITNSGVYNFNAILFSAYDHVRSITANETNNSYGVNESWLVQQTGLAPGTAVEDFTISLRKSADNSLNTVSIEGTIQGVESRDASFSILTTKYESASGTWGIVKDRLLGRANLLLDTISTTRDVNIIPLSQVIGHNPNTGSISYSYEFNDRPSNCITGALFETITIIDNNPTDVFAKQVILGKSSGPILQDLSTVTESTRELNIEAVMTPATGCPTAGNVPAYFAQRPDAEIDAIVDAIETDLESNYGSVFRSIDQVTWNPKEGRIAVQVGWTYTPCE